MSTSEAEKTPSSAKARAAASTSFSRVFDASGGIAGTVGAGPESRRPRVARSVLVDLVAGRRQDVPLGAELVEALAVDVARLGVGHVRVEGVAVVGDLSGAVGPRRRAQLGGSGA